nr:copia protein [Tanacetum cinerariifolium]
MVMEQMAWQTNYCIMKEGMSILRGQKSVPGMNSSERGMERGYYSAFTKVKESLNVTFDETPPPSNTSPLVDDDLDEKEAIMVTEKKNLENNVVDETLEIDEIVNIKESRNYPLENVIGNLNQRTLRLVAQGYNQQEGIDYDETYAPVARLESIRILLAYAYALDFKLFQMDVKSAFLNGFISEEVYVAQPPGFIDFEKPDHVYKLKKALYGLKQAPKEAPKTSHLEAIKRIFQYIKGTTHLGLWYPKRTGIETVVYADSDHVGDYVDRKSTSGICTFVGCCLTSWFSKKQTALAISTTEAEYVSAGKAGHKDHVSACLFHMLYCIESLSPYNLAFFVLKQMEKTQNKHKELLPYGMLLSRLFKHTVSVFLELAIDRYLSFDRVMHPFTPYYERKTRSDHGKKRPRESNASSSSSTTLNHPSSSHPLDNTLDENDDESFHSNSSSPS